MALFSGLARTDYQDILRAIGSLCDANDWHNLRIIECEQGIILQYTEGATRRDPLTYLLTEADLGELLHDAYGRRGTAHNGRPFVADSTSGLYG
jgi:hypothetical protein